ncbi:hypothetical protein Q3G72_032905 [Acer saccharum]|nr:hypothetical protein Q3G72_032905 [Acer saccharum]
MRRFGDHSQLSELDSGETELLTAMLVALESAGALRGKAARGLVEILSPIQTVKVMAAAAQLHLKVRGMVCSETNEQQPQPHDLNRLALEKLALFEKTPTLN